MNIKSTNRKKSQIAIENALFELIQTKPINNISISEICKKYHFFMYFELFVQKNENCRFVNDMLQN